jgi:hypothetical protein
MTSLDYQKPPEQLVRLRQLVEEWTRKAKGAVGTFQRSDGSFWKDSGTYSDAKESGKDPEKTPPNLTSTARAYMALVAADQVLADDSPGWKEPFNDFVTRQRLRWKGGSLYEVGNDQEMLNNFDIAHLTDFVIAEEYLARFFEKHNTPTNVLGSLTGSSKKHQTAKLTKMLVDALKKSANDIALGGQVLFENEETNSRHYFATLHALRAISILKTESKAAVLAPELAEAARAFCIQQCYYFQRGIRHKQDPVRLVFSGCIYALFEDHIDKDLCLATVEALGRSQQENGSWPATHPVFRKDLQPWHIASHEVALCLTWLYFQPRVPDHARPPLLSMMEKYFSRSVIPTFVQSKADGKLFQGWQDDHTVSSDTAVGWATAIVCHFLANYLNVLNDWINRSVIEALNLQQAALHYLIDDTSNERSRSFKWKNEKAPVVWPDLPPFAWRLTWDAKSAKATTAEIRAKWSDPSDGANITNDLVTKIISTIFQRPGDRPVGNRCSAILPGSPGTRKTTLVGVLSEVLEWPMIAVPSSLIFERGFDLMEAQANMVFQNLTYLRGCVIFFDEFEEFFLARSEQAKSIGEETAEQNRAGEPIRAVRGHDKLAPSKGYQSRTIAAFTTSAMLPRLQELHNEARCLIFLATNHPEKIDPAIARVGRFDFRI